MTGGTYTLLVELPAPDAVTVGALGEHALPAGWYAYTGSALGPGGFARVDRHRRTAAGDHGVRHWHVDYLLGETPARIAGVVRSPGDDVECRVARAVDGETPIPGFGASDCGCRAHLAYRDARDRLESSVRDAHATASG